MLLFTLESDISLNIIMFLPTMTHKLQLWGAEIVVYQHLGTVQVERRPTTSFNTPILRKT